jgi:cob(I)alamin adenosyltransferase
MLYTKKGDRGTTKTFGCDQRISKSSAVTEALGALDETNSFLGLVRAQAQNASFKIKKNKIKFADIVLEIEQNLFIIQAEVAGSTLVISAEKTKRAEEIINEIEKILPPIKNFFLSGATKLSALFDFARTLARRAERRVVEVKAEGKVSVGEETLAYLNRLSSLLYALARISSYSSRAKEIKPNYK